MNYDNSINQKIKAEFVQREIIGLASDIVQRLQDLEDEWFDNWEVENIDYHPCPECRGTMEEKEDDSTVWVCNDCKKEVNDADVDTEIQEVYEYWFVSEWLANKLSEEGEMIIKEFSLSIWGRGCSGQAILLDSVISHICEDLGILEGQKDEWKI